MVQKKNLSILSLNMCFGGAQRVISLLLIHLIKDYNVSLVLFYDHVDFEIPKEVNIKVLFPKDNNKNTFYRKIKETLLVSRKYNKFIKNNNIDISMAFLALPNIINGIVAKKNTKLRTVISERCFPSLMYRANKSSQFLANYVIPIFYNKNDALFSNSININEDLKKNFNIKIPMSVIYNPIIIDENKRILTDSIKSKKILNFINVGSIYEAKNQSMILNALALLNKSEYHYTQAGSGAMEEEIKTYTKKLGLNNNTTFLGNISNVKDYLLNNDCFVLSSKTEGFPNVVLEALATGLPVISTNCMTGPLELLNDNESIDIRQGDFTKAKYGLLVNVDDAEGLAKALEYFKDNPEERKRYSELGFKRAKQNLMPIIYDQVKKLLEY
jgi:glycosyltransferase involved in cell wall biosynthesis